MDADGRGLGIESDSVIGGMANFEQKQTKKTKWVEDGKGRRDVMGMIVIRCLKACGGTRGNPSNSSIG
jgi:hypothetical protein